MEDLSKILSSMQEAKASAKDIRQALAHMRAEGSAGAGAVNAIVDGNKSIKKLEIDKAYLLPEEKEVLQDLIIAAINAANNAAEEQVQEKVKQKTVGILERFPTGLGV